MREFKFRAWDKENDRFFKPTYEAYKGNLEDLNIKLSGQLLMRNMSNTPIHESLFPDRFVLQQYTGMQDMNCQDIYEGDIVRRNFEVGRVTYDEVSLGADGYEIIDAGHFIGVVTYRPSNGFILNQCRKYNEENELISKRSGVKVHPQYAEVLGNIYETPELLEGLK